MVETVLQYFQSLHVARNIRDYVNYWNELTGEYVFRDEGFDTEEMWRDRGVWDVCCITMLDRPQEGWPENIIDLYRSINDDDIAIPKVALRIATEKGWRRV